MQDKGQRFFFRILLAAVIDSILVESEAVAEGVETSDAVQRWRVNMLRALPEDPHSITTTVECEVIREPSCTKSPLLESGNRMDWVMVRPEEFTTLPQNVIKAEHRQYERAVRHEG